MISAGLNSLATDAGSSNGLLKSRYRSQTRAEKRIDMRDVSAIEQVEELGDHVEPLHATEAEVLQDAKVYSR